MLEPPETLETEPADRPGNTPLFNQGHQAAAIKTHPDLFILIRTNDVRADMIKVEIKIGSGSNWNSQGITNNSFPHQSWSGKSFLKAFERFQQFSTKPECSKFADLSEPRAWETAWFKPPSNKANEPNNPCNKPGEPSSRPDTNPGESMKITEIFHTHKND